MTSPYDIIYILITIIVLSIIIIYCNLNHEDYTKKTDTFCSKYLH